MKFSFLFLFLLFSSCGHFQNPKNTCSRIMECVELNSKLTGNKYLINIDFKGAPINTVGNIGWTSENADYLLGEMLSSEGYMRLKIIGTDVYQLVTARDIRYVGNVPKYHATKTTSDPLPPPVASDWIELIYKPISANASEIARNLRPFMSRYGRVIDEKNSNLVILVDNLTSAHRSLGLMREMDVPMPAELKAERDKDKKYQELKEISRREYWQHIQFLMDNNKTKELSEEKARVEGVKKEGPAPK